MASFVSTFFLLEDRWKALKITRFFVWPLLILLYLHWIFDSMVMTMKGKVKEFIMDIEDEGLDRKPIIVNGIY